MNSTIKTVRDIIIRQDLQSSDLDSILFTNPGLSLFLENRKRSKKSYTSQFTSDREKNPD